MNYLELLNYSYDIGLSHGENTPYSFLSSAVFDFTTYSDEMDELFVKKAIEVCVTITEASTFTFIEDKHEQYLMMCNMPFFSEKIEWGTSIRGAWWNYEITLSSCGLWKDGEQMLEPLVFDVQQWGEFIEAMVLFLERQE